jgi:hypothetical protein
MYKVSAVYELTVFCASRHRRNKNLFQLYLQFGILERIYNIRLYIYIYIYCDIVEIMYIVSAAYMLKHI